MRSHPPAARRFCHLLAVLLAAAASQAVTAGSAAAEPSGSQTFSFDDSTQYFTVPSGISELRLTGWGGSGGTGQNFANSNEYQALGGLGALVSEDVAVQPGDTLVVELGGSGENAQGGSGGGLSSGDAENGGAGGDSSFSSGTAGGGGGGGTEVVDADSGAVLLNAGGGGGGGGGGVDQAANGGEGGDAGSGIDSSGEGYGSEGQGGVAGSAGAYASTGQVGGANGASGTSGAGGGAGGGGGGGYAPGGGGGGGGSASSAGGGGSGGGAGASYAPGTNVQLGNAAVGDGGLVVSWGVPDTAPSVKSTAFGFNDQTQYFTVPASDHSVEIYGSGGAGGAGGFGAGPGQQAVPGGLGALFGVQAAVNPGDTLVVEVGGAGSTTSGSSGGAGGLSSGDTENGGPGGNLNSSDGNAGGGGGGGTEVVDADTGAVLLDAGGGGGGGGAGNGALSGAGYDGGPGGDAGSAFANPGAPDLYGDGYSGGGVGIGAGGIFASSGSPQGTSGTGETPGSGGGTGGGGGGGDVTAGGGGTGGSQGTYGGGGAGGGGAGASELIGGTANPVIANGLPGDGSVTILAEAPLTLQLPSQLNSSVGASYSSSLAGLPSGGTPPYQLSVASGSLPPGLTLSSDGELSGRPMQPGTFTGTLQATDSSDPAQTATAPFSFVIARGAYPAVWTVSATSDLLESFNLGSSGDVAPLNSLSGPVTNLGHGGGVAVDSSGNVLVANPSTQSVTIYANPGSGDEAASAAIAGSETKLHTPVAVAVGPSGWYVANQANNTITAYTSSGNTRPALTIGGVPTDLSGPDALAFDAHGDLWVADLTSNSLTEYAPGANGRPTPIAIVSGAATGLSRPSALAVTPSGTILVANSSDNTITGYSPTANGDQAPVVKIAGGATQLREPDGVGVDSSGEIYVSDRSSDAITEYAPSARGDAAPLATIAGSDTGLTAPGRLAVVPLPGQSTTSGSSARSGARRRRL